MDLPTLQDRHIVITGASRGIGHAVAQACHERGARISVCARSETEIHQLAKRTGAVAAVLDVTDPEAVDEWLHVAAAQYGPIDVLINNAATLGPMLPLVDWSFEDFQHVMKVNATGAFVVTQSALPRMTAPGGRILWMSSYVGRHGLPNYGAYTESKFALEGLAQVVALEHQDAGIISVSVDPGMVQTEMLQAATGNDDVSEFTPVADAANEMLVLIQELTIEDSGVPQALFPDAG